jgi:hypothetical protein
MNLVFKGTKVGHMSGKARTTHEATPEFDKQWYIDYVEDRRRRGIPSAGTPVDGETPWKLRGDAGPEYCACGHNLQVVGFKYRIINGYRVRECQGCRRDAYTRRQERRHEEAAARCPREVDRTHCPHGHEYTPENTYTAKGGARKCRACSVEHTRKYRARIREERGPRVHVTVCVHGHEYTPENTYIAKNGTRKCRECGRLYRAKYARLRKMAATS